MIKWVKFCIKEMWRSHHQLFSFSFETETLKEDYDIRYNETKYQTICLCDEPNYCRTLEPL